MEQFNWKPNRIYHFLFDEIADPITKHFPLVGKPYQGIALLGLYLMFVLKWGPKWMTNRPAFQLDKVLMIYNLLQVAANIYIFIASTTYIMGHDFKLFCQPVNYSNTEEAFYERKIVYYYFLLKISDLLDTVFFVLRKKTNQISFLHLYHHTGMILLVWGCATYYPGGHGGIFGIINSFVHVIMYFYYFLSVAVHSIRQQLWIKKLITQIQLVQFLLTILHTSVLIFKTECDFPRFAAPLLIPHNIFLFVLFADFYIKTYIKSPKAEVHANDVKKEHNNGTVGNVINNVNGKSVNGKNANGSSVNRNNVNGLKSEKNKSL